MAIVLFALIIVGMFVFAFLKQSEINEHVPATEVSVLGTTTPDTYASINRVDAKYFYGGGVHTIVGQIVMPTPCDLLNWSTSTIDAQHLLVQFTVVNNAVTCDQTITPERFKASWNAPQNAVIGATFMGRTIDLNLVPAGLGETPDQFELFLKG